MVAVGKIYDNCMSPSFRCYLNEQLDSPQLHNNTAYKENLFVSSVKRPDK